MDEIIHKEARATSNFTAYVEIGALTFRATGTTETEKYWDDSVSIEVEVDDVSLLASSFYWPLAVVIPDCPASQTENFESLEEKEIDNLYLQLIEKIILGRFAPWLG